MSSVVNGDVDQARAVSASPTAAPSMGSRASWETSRAERAKRYADIAIDDREHHFPPQSSTPSDPNIEISPLRYAVDALERQTSFQLDDVITDSQLHPVNGSNEDVGTKLLKKAQDQAKRSKLAIIEENLENNNQTLPQPTLPKIQLRDMDVNAAKQSADGEDDIERSSFSLGDQPQAPAENQVARRTQDEKIVEFLGELQCHSSDINPRSDRLHSSIADQRPRQSIHDLGKVFKTMPPNRTSGSIECCIVSSQIGLHNCGCYPSSLSTDFIQHRDDDQCCIRTQQLGHHTCGCHLTAVGDLELLRSSAPATRFSDDENSKSAREMEKSAYQRFIARLEAEKRKESVTTGVKKKLHELTGE